MQIDNAVLQIAVEDIVPNRFQPRLVFSDDSLMDLAASIKAHGIIQPLVLRRVNDKYEIVSGERRYRAAKLAGLSAVPGIVTTIDDKTSAELALIENVQRNSLNAIEEARGYKNVMETNQLSADMLASKLGVGTDIILNKLNLLKLTPEAQDALLNKKISEGHARSLLKVTDPELQNKWLNKIINERLNVKDLDEKIKNNELDTPEKENIPVEKPLIQRESRDIIPPKKDEPTLDGMSSLGSISLGQTTERPSFFNSLEDESVNMSTKEEKSIFDITANVSDGIESLDFEPVIKETKKSKLDNFIKENNLEHFENDLDTKIVYTIEVPKD